MTVRREQPSQIATLEFAVALHDRNRHTPGLVCRPKRASEIVRELMTCRGKFRYSALGATLQKRTTTINAVPDTTLDPSRHCLVLLPENETDLGGLDPLISVVGDPTVASIPAKQYAFVLRRRIGRVARGNLVLSQHN